MVRTVLVDVLGEGAGQDRAVAAANAVEDGGAVVGLAARAVLMLADWPAWGVLVQLYHGDVLTVLEGLGPGGGFVPAGRAGQGTDRRLGTASALATQPGLAFPLLLRDPSADRSRQLYHRVRRRGSWVFGPVFLGRSARRR